MICLKMNSVKSLEYLEKLYLLGKTEPEFLVWEQFNELRTILILKRAI